jgi:hypothetical protein
MANPKVRPSLHFYPEDSGQTLEEARQASRWLHELRSEETSPMIRIRNIDYYIFEPTMLADGSVCLPTRWFTRHGSYFGKALLMQKEMINQTKGWVVLEDREIEISQNELLKDFLQLSADTERYNLPHPSVIFGMYLERKESFLIYYGTGFRNTNLPGNLKPWTKTDPALGNRWRVLSKGHRTLAMPLWLYCDDTSGNISKKWNEHNSFLFTLAGLPRSEASKEYNVHFLCTSNLAPPLEMMDGVVSQIELVISHFNIPPFFLINFFTEPHKKVVFGLGIVF